MNPVTFRSLALAAALAGTAGLAAAQETTGALLNTVELRQLVARADAADNARLAAHFTALANRYIAEAKRHVSMSQSFVGNPSRNLGSGMSVHCKRLADLNTQSATAVRELAAYHEKLAAGTPAAAPSGGARFQGGAGAAEPTVKDLDALAAKASTHAEHMALVEYFLTLAKRYTAEANEHSGFAQAYRGSRIAQAAGIHERLARVARESAKEAAAAADIHKGLVTTGR